MIQDPSGRYLMTRLDGMLWRYDRRWRNATNLDFPNAELLSVAEGAGYMSVTVRDGDAIVVTVRGPQFPEEPIAKGVYKGDSWEFSGDNSAWAWVPDYVLVPNGEDHHGLLRVADGARLDALQEITADVLQAVDVPNSRLVLLVTSGGWSVYDPEARRSFGRQNLAEENPTPTMRFRTPEEVWVNDSSTMLKLDSKQFEIQDAAGSEIGVQDPESAGKLGQFGRWTFAGGNELCVIPRPILGDVLILDAVSMYPVAQASFSTGEPVDAAMTGRNTVVGVAADGRVLRARARRIKVSAPRD